MLDSALIDYSYTQPWADLLIEAIEGPPSWLCDVATKKYTGDQKKAFREYLSSEPFVQRPADCNKFHIGCLWLRYERRELSWATYLQQAGEYLDASGAGWDCETPYHYLNCFEDAYFSIEAEEETKRKYLKDHNVLPWAALASQRLEPFKISRMTNKSRDHIASSGAAHD